MIVDGDNDKASRREADDHKQKNCLMRYISIPTEDTAIYWLQSLWKPDKGVHTHIGAKTTKRDSKSPNSSRKPGWHAANHRELC